MVSKVKKKIRYSWFHPNEILLWCYTDIEIARRLKSFVNMIIIRLTKREINRKKEVIFLPVKVMTYYNKKDILVVDISVFTKNHEDILMNKKFIPLTKSVIKWYREVSKIDYILTSKNIKKDNKDWDYTVDDEFKNILKKNANSISRFRRRRGIPERILIRWPNTKIVFVSIRYSDKKSVAACMGYNSCWRKELKHNKN